MPTKKKKKQKKRKNCQKYTLIVDSTSFCVKEIYKSWLKYNMCSNGFCMARDVRTVEVKHQQNYSRNNNNQDT